MKDGPRFVGFVGLHSLAGQALPFHAEAEVGWRLAAAAWGRGYAPEAALATLEFGYLVCGLSEIVSFTSTVNGRSRRVMEKIGMHRDPDDDFEHPRIAEGHPLRSHVLYRLGAGEWRSAQGAPLSGIY